MTSKRIPQRRIQCYCSVKRIQYRLPLSPHLYVHGLVHLSILIGEVGLTTRPTIVNMQRINNSGMLSSKCYIISNFPASGLITEEDAEGLLLVVISLFLKLYSCGDLPLRSQINTRRLIITYKCLNLAWIISFLFYFWFFYRFY